MMWTQRQEVLSLLGERSVKQCSTLISILLRSRNGNVLPGPTSLSHDHTTTTAGLDFPAVTEPQLDNAVVAERSLDGARTNPHIPHTPDDGEHYFQRTLALGKPSTAFDAHVLEQEGVLQHHPNFNINPVAERHHPLTLLYPTAREHVHELLVAALTASDCCHREPSLIQRVVTLMNTDHNTTDYHKGVLAAGVLLLFLVSHFQQVSQLV